MLEARGSTDVGELARHAFETTDHDRQRRYFAAAAERAEGQYANDLARVWYQRLLPLLDPPESARVRVALGRLEVIVGELETAAVLFGDAIGESEGPERERAVLELGQVQVMRGDPAGFAAIDDVVDRAASEGHWLLAREGLERAAELASMLGDVERAESVEARQRGFAASLGEANLLGKPIPFLASLLWSRGELDAAATRYEQLFDDYHVAGDLVRAGALAADLGGINYERGDVASSLEWLRRGEECFERIGHERSIVRLIRGNEVALRVDAGDRGGARRIGLLAADRALALGDVESAAEVFVAVAPAAASVDEAMALLDAAELVVTRLGLDAVRHHIVAVRARVLAADGAFGDAVDVLAATGVDVDPDLAVEETAWRVRSGQCQVADADRVFDELREVASPTALVVLADTLADAAPNQWRRDRARDAARAAAPLATSAASRELLRRHGVEAAPAPDLGPAPDGVPPDVEELLGRVDALLVRRGVVAG